VIASMTHFPAITSPAETASLDPLLTPDQVQEYMGVSRWWIDKYSRRANDPLPWIGTPRVRRMRHSTLLAWLARNQEQNDGADPAGATAEPAGETAITQSARTGQEPR